jgi:hypothetical protein
VTASEFYPFDDRMWPPQSSIRSTIGRGRLRVLSVRQLFPVVVPRVDRDDTQELFESRIIDFLFEKAVTLANPGVGETGLVLSPN